MNTSNTDPLLGKRLIEATELILQHRNKKLEDILAYPDNLKFLSSMDLFNKASRNLDDNINLLFKDAIRTFCY